MRQLSLLVALALPLLAPARALGSWLAPPPVEWSVTPDGQFEVRRENQTGRVTIFDAGRKHALWSVEDACVRELFCALALVADGSLLVQISGNHGVSALDDEVVVIYRRSGGSLEIRAGQLITGLVVVLDSTSLSSKFRWLEEVERVTDGSLVLLNALRERKRIELSTGRVSDDREAAAPRARTVGVELRAD